MKIGSSVQHSGVVRVIVEFVKPVPSMAEATEAEVRAPKANAMLGTMAALDDSELTRVCAL